MHRSDRLFDIHRILRDGRLHRAQDLADQLNVSLRTIYRDMDTLIASGVPVEGARGVGYRITEARALPPLTLSAAEMEALNLGIAIVAEAADPDLKSAALSLGAKIDAVSPSRTVAQADEWNKQREQLKKKIEQLNKQLAAMMQKLKKSANTDLPAAQRADQQQVLKAVEITSASLRRAGSTLSGKGSVSSKEGRELQGALRQLRSAKAKIGNGARS